MFDVKWIFVKDIKSTALQHIVLPNCENKPVTNTRDAQEILLPQGYEMLRVFAEFKGAPSLLDDYDAYNALIKVESDKIFKDTPPSARPAAPAAPAAPSSQGSSRGPSA